MTYITSKIICSVEFSSFIYYKLVILVGHLGSGKTEILGHVSKYFGVDIINFNIEISSQLLDLSYKQRALKLPNISHEILDRTKYLAVLDNLEILFDINLKQDPLRLLQRLSRNRVIVVSWNGSFADGKLIYAEPGHPEYRSYDAVDALIVSMDGTATVDSATNNREAGQA